MDVVERAQAAPTEMAAPPALNEWVQQVAALTRRLEAVESAETFHRQLQSGPAAGKP